VFITFEGVDGAGKSSRIPTVVDWLTRRGRTVVQTREPGGTPLGEKLRVLLLNESMDLETEALLMFASRKEHLSTLIQPSLASGSYVVSDRFTDATYAYQVGGRGLDSAKFSVLEKFVHPGFQPDLTFLFDLDPVLAARRRASSGETLDRFEREALDFFERVRNAYMERARSSNGRIHIIDSSQTPDEIDKQLVRICESEVDKYEQRRRPVCKAGTPE
jgi:dTMP kinase